MPFQYAPAGKADCDIVGSRGFDDGLTVSKCPISGSGSSGRHAAAGVRESSFRGQPGEATVGGRGVGLGLAICRRACRGTWRYDRRPSIECRRRRDVPIHGADRRHAASGRLERLTPHALMPDGPDQSLSSSSSKTKRRFRSFFAYHTRRAKGYDVIGVTTGESRRASCCL